MQFEKCCRMSLPSKSDNKKGRLSTGIQEVPEYLIDHILEHCRRTIRAMVDMIFPLFLLFDVNKIWRLVITISIISVIIGF